MTTKNAILSKWTKLCILGVGLLACAVDDNAGTGSITHGIPENIKEAFDQVVQVLHAPYKNGDLFFRIFTGDKAINERKNGVDSQIGKGTGTATNTGSGTWTVIAGKDKKVADGDSAAAAPPADNSIIYSYTKYQPNGANIYVNGKMLAMYRSKNFVAGIIADFIAGVSGNGVDSIGFNTAGIGSSSSNQVMAVAGNMVDTLTIDGAYDATLTFTYIGKRIELNITEFTYDQNLFGDDEGLFISMGAKVEFTYDGKTIKLDKEQLQKLLHVTKG